MAAAFNTFCSFSFIGNECIETGSQKRSEPCFTWIISIKELLFQDLREKCLRKILCVVYGFVPPQPQILVDRLPVCLDDGVQRIATFRGIFTSGRNNCR